MQHIPSTSTMIFPMCAISVASSLCRLSSWGIASSLFWIWIHTFLFHGICPCGLWRLQSVSRRFLRSSCTNQCQGKSMLKNKSPQIARDYMSSYVGYIRDERTIAHVIVERVSNMKCKQWKQLTTTWWMSSRQHWTPLKERCQPTHVDTDGL